MLLEVADHVPQRCGAAGVAEAGYHGIHASTAGGTAEGEQGMTTDKAAAGPSAVADEVTAAPHGCDGAFGKLQTKLIGDKQDDAGAVA